MWFLPIEPSSVKKRWRLQPGKIFLIDLIEKKIVNNEEIKEKYATKNNYESHLKNNQICQDLCVGTCQDVSGCVRMCRGGIIVLSIQFNFISLPY